MIEYAILFQGILFLSFGLITISFSTVLSGKYKKWLAKRMRKSYEIMGQIPDENAIKKLVENAYYKKMFIFQGGFLCALGCLLLAVWYIILS